MSLEEGGPGRFGTEGNMTLKQEATLLTLKMDSLVFLPQTHKKKKKKKDKKMDKATKECKECSFRSWKGKEMDLPQSLGRGGRAAL